MISTTIFITASKTTPAVGEPVTFTITLTSGSPPPTNPSFTNYLNNVRTNDIIKTTDANGAYTFTRSESTSGPYTYFALFNGDTTPYSASSSSVVTLTVGTLTPTSITITTTNNNPAANQPFTLSGTLRVNGTALSGKSITFQRLDSSGTWTQIGTATTAANGTYTFTRSESTSGPYTYFALFNGDTTYAPSYASIRISL